MRISRFLALAVVSSALGLGAARSDAAAITDLFNTGVDGSGVVLPDNAVDPHYTLVSNPLTSGSSPSWAVNPPANNSFPVPPWAANNALSEWTSGPVHPLDGGVGNLPNGLYLYRTTFTIGAGFLPSTASITGVLSGDDQVSVQLNGTTVVGNTPDQGYGSLFPFSITTNFVQGTNTLDFLVLNNHLNVEGLRVQMTGTVFTSAVPEPSSMVLMGLGTVGLLGFVRRRRAA